jgi:hypothetical protein
MPDLYWVKTLVGRGERMVQVHDLRPTMPIGSLRAPFGSMVGRKYDRTRRPFEVPGVLLKVVRGGEA